MTKIIGPGSTIGILGSGQLGRMLAISARQMGYRVAVFGGDRLSPCGQVCDLIWPEDYNNEALLHEFASVSDVVTYEFENIPAHAAAAIAARTELRPAVGLLGTAQNRFLEKTALTKLGLPTARFRMVQNAAELVAAHQDFGGDVILKANTEGYDGKGQWGIGPDADVAAIWESSELTSGLVEQKVAFDYELSMIAGRFADGHCAFFDPFLNHHANHILDVSISGSPLISAQVASQAEAMGRAVLEHFDVVGVLCIELFLTSSGELVVNEIAPRPHNSGHLTIEAYNCSQFELQLRTICGLPHVAINRMAPIAAMANLLGQHLPPVWTQNAVDAVRNAHLHLYGKQEPKTNRKMGHVTVLGSNPDEAETNVRTCRDGLLA